MLDIRRASIDRQSFAGRIDLDDESGVLAHLRSAKQNRSSPNPVAFDRNGSNEHSDFGEGYASNSPPIELCELG
ncbi:MAG: hypothetical protein J7641_21250 [Cyanobacteria bacterium SID2]|nr:hypothetical protein [Cyanobacteria bacterium SID2]